MLLSIILTFQGCVKNYTHPEIELVKFNQDSSYYYITFLSDINFSTRKSSKNTGSYVHCIVRFMMMNIFLTSLQTII